MRVLIAYEDSHRSYGGALEGAIRLLRPAVETSLVHADELGSGVEHSDPHLVVSSRPNGADPGGRAAWVKLSEEPGSLSEVCVGGKRKEAENPGLEELLSVLDETEE